MTENRLTYLALDLPPTLFSSVLAPFRSIIVILFVDLVVISLPFIRLQIPGKGCSSWTFGASHYAEHTVTEWWVKATDSVYNRAGTGVIKMSAWQLEPLFCSDSYSVAPWKHLSLCEQPWDNNFLLALHVCPFSSQKACVGNSEL